MKIIAIAAVTAGGKTTIVNEIKKQLKKVEILHFDDYSFEGEVDDFYAWVMQGADDSVWDLSEYSDCAFFIDTPLDIAMARRVLRDMKESTGEEIRQDMEMYMKYARVAYVQMLNDVLPCSDYVIDGTKELEEKVEEIMKIILAL